MDSHRAPPDQAQRDAAIEERERNVLVDAGAGTGKTSLLVSRLVRMVAPDDETRAVPIHRIAAITFTRKAAGELRLRIRERLLKRLARAAVDSADERSLRDALAGLDTAYVGTIHGFADRLLRLHPGQAKLSPAYEVTDDDEPLLQEAYELLLGAAQAGTMAQELARYQSLPLAAEATDTVLTALATGIRAETRVWKWSPRLGLDALVAGFLRQRDLPPGEVSVASADLQEVRAAIDEFLALSDASDGVSEGARWVARQASRLRQLRDETDPETLRREVHWLPRAPDLRMRDMEKSAWPAFRDWDKKLGKRVSAPLDRWMATRLVRLFPVVNDLYDRVKRRRQKLDQLDLLVRLRDLLLDRTVRERCQALFDHIFVDEFQDTDPLQAEIVLFLCERGARAEGWEDVELQPGKLTLVGDPKQSIYRFRRADVAMYDRVRDRVRGCGALEVELSTSFRSVPALVDWFNDRFPRVLGVSKEGKRFDVETGSVFHQQLRAYREATAGPAVHVVPLVLGEQTKEADWAYRALEAKAIARYLRWLVERSGFSVRDKGDGSDRPVRFGDVAILALSTTTLAPLFPELDREGIPYASRGGRLFLSDPLIRRLALALRAVSDADDGVAEAALLAPPFFAVSPVDLWREQVAAREGAELADEGARRARRARAWLRELRRRRHVRPPGATARDLLEETGLGRVLATGTNGRQRLARARELCMRLEARAASDGLDLDAATALLRRWAADPIEMDPPHPVGTEALQVLTVHQAKGLEFPVVVMWDGRAKWERAPERPAWRRSRDGPGWIVELWGLECEQPEIGLHRLEKKYQEAERKRVAYVAATRARDLLVLPGAGELNEKRHLFATFLEDLPPGLVREMAPFAADEEPDWSGQLGAPRAPRPPPVPGLEEDVAREWAAAARESERPLFRPVSVTTMAHEQTDDDVGPGKRREGRRGPLFGEAVHLAIGAAIRGVPPKEAVARAASRVSLRDHLDEVGADVERALQSLRSAGLLADDVVSQLEYPLAGRGAGGTLVTGFADFVAIAEGRLVVIDFKTDRPPEGDASEAMPEYAEQVRAYGRLLRGGGLGEGAKHELGLLFTADGGIRWIDP